MRRFCAYLLVALVCVWGSIGPALADHRWDHDQGYDYFEAGNYAKALEIWHQLAEKGSVNAQYNLGVLHARGLGVPQDFKAAFNWYLRAAEQGDPRAAVNVGSMYAFGLGVEHDHFEAYKWFLIARKGRDAEQAALVEELIGDLNEVLSHKHHSLTEEEMQRAAAAADAWMPYRLK